MVKRSLGKGGKKKVYLAHDSVLDRDVAFALIKTEGPSEVARTRIMREVQAKECLGDHSWHGPPDLSHLSGAVWGSRD